jgi:hypothetical protein
LKKKYKKEKIQEEFVEMLGILIGCALRTSVYLKLKFPNAIWKLLTGESLDILDFKEFDLAFYTEIVFLGQL